jgi:hypothetical protein
MTPGERPAPRLLGCDLAGRGRVPGAGWRMVRTVLDPDGNYVQIIELTDAYRVARRTRLL